MMGKLRNRGFTLVEILIALSLAGLLITAIYTVFLSQNKSYIGQEQVVDMQQNLRSSMDLMVREIRMAGYDPSRTGNFSISDIRPDAQNNGTITFAADWDDSGTLDASEDANSNGQLDSGEDSNGNSVLDLGETITFSLSSSQLMRNIGGSANVLAENVKSFGLAYAFDQNGDGAIDTSAGGNIIWAIDTDGDNDLDKSLDTNDDGIINSSDNASGTALSPNIGLDRIRGVQIWLLTRSSQPSNQSAETQTYAVANQRITPNDNYRYRLLTATVKPRNLAL